VGLAPSGEISHATQVGEEGFWWEQDANVTASPSGGAQDEVEKGMEIRMATPCGNHDGVEKGTGSIDDE